MTFEDTKDSSLIERSNCVDQLFTGASYLMHERLLQGAIDSPLFAEASWRKVGERVITRFHRCLQFPFARDDSVAGVTQRQWASLSSTRTPESKVHRVTSGCRMRSMTLLRQKASA